MRQRAAPTARLVKRGGADPPGAGENEIVDDDAGMVFHVRSPPGAPCFGVA
jgi:hypothetical protein